MAKRMMQVVSVTISASADKPLIANVGKPMSEVKARAMAEALNEKEIDGTDLDLNKIVAFDVRPADPPRPQVKRVYHDPRDPMFNTYVCEDQ
jgi:hypothetical protein